MKKNRILSVLLAVMVVMTVFYMPAATAAEYEKTVEVEQTTGSAGHTSLAVWGTYVFTLNPYELIVTDLLSSDEVVKWDVRQIVGGADADYTSVIVPKMVLVNDKYIVISMAKKVVVLENPGYFKNASPKIVAKFGNYNCPRILLDNDTLVIINYEGKTSYCIKVDMEVASTVPGVEKGLNTSDRSMVNSGAAASVELGYYAGRMWKQADMIDNTVYIGAYTGGYSAPYGDLYLLEINLETMELNKILVDNGPLTGVSGKVPNDLTMEDVASGALVNTWSREDLGLTNETWSGEKLIANGRLRTDTTGQQWFDYQGFDAFQSMHPKYSEARMQVGALLFGLKVGENIYNLEYSRTDAMLNGVISADEKYVYMTSGSTGNSQWTFPCKLWIVDRQTGELVSSTVLKNYYNGGVTTEVRNAFQNSYIIGDTLVGMVDRLDDNIALIDVSDPKNIDCNIDNGSVELAGSSTSSKNQWASGQFYGGRVFYPLNNGEGFGIINLGSDCFSANLKQLNTPYPIILCGEASGEDDIVNIQIDDVNYSAASKLGVYSTYILSGMKNGAHKVMVSSKNGEKAFDFSIDAPLAVEIDNIELENNRITASIVNNTDQYTDKTEEVNIVIVSYDKDGFMGTKAEKTVSAEFGVTEEFESDELQPLSQGGCYMIYILAGNKPLRQPIKVTLDSVSSENEAVIIGTPRETELKVEKRVLERTALISGQSMVNNRVMIIVKANNEPVMYKQINCDSQGNFEYEYDFSDLGYGKSYEIAVTAGFSETVSDRFDDIEESVIEKVKEGLSGKSGVQLLKYLEENKDIAAFLGVDLSNKNFSALNDKRKAEVMNAVAEKIKADELAEARIAFEEKSESLIGKQIIDNAILVLNKASKDEIFGNLSENQQLYEISDELWKEYTELSKSDMKAVNTKFAKYEIETIEDISIYLKKAIKSVKEDDGSTSGLIGGSGNGSGKAGTNFVGNSTSVNPYVPVKAKEKFIDLDGVEWAKESIEALEMAGVVDGIGNSLFAPYSTVTREQFIKMLVLAFEISSQEGDVSFSDVNKEDWFYDYVRIADVMGISKGNDQGMFGVGEALSREDAAVFAFRTVEALGKTLPKNKEGVEFTDSAAISEYANTAVENMQKAGIINGLDDGSFAPGEACNRAMAAKFVYELMLAVR